MQARGPLAPGRRKRRKGFRTPGEPATEPDSAALTPLDLVRSHILLVTLHTKSVSSIGGLLLHVFPERTARVHRSDLAGVVAKNVPHRSIHARDTGSVKTLNGNAEAGLSCTGSLYTGQSVEGIVSGGM